jgi:hypothetical protein
LWLSGDCDKFQFDFADEVETIMRKLYSSETVNEYVECIELIAEPFDLEQLTKDQDKYLPILLGDELPEPKNLEKSSVVIEELKGGSRPADDILSGRESLSFILFFSSFGIFGSYILYQIFSGNATPTIGQTVYTMGSKMSSPKPYVIESEYHIYEYLMSRIIVSLMYLLFSIYMTAKPIYLLANDMKQDFPTDRISFLKLQSLNFIQQNQIIEYFGGKISQLTSGIPAIKSSSTNPEIQTSQTNTIVIPELESIKSSSKSKTKLSGTNLKISDIDNNFGMTSVAVKLEGWNGRKIQPVEEFNLRKLTELKEISEKNSFRKMMAKCLPSVFKRLGQSKKK